MKKSLFLTAIFLVSLMSPVALAGVTETQFQDGSTSYTHTFTGTGDGFAGNLTFPYGAEVTSASFDISGEPSSTSWGNMTTNVTLVVLEPAHGVVRLLQDLHMVVAAILRSVMMK